MKVIKKKVKSGDDGGSAPGWMVTYGDLMTLLLTFFVLIVSFSAVREAQFKEALGSLKRALGVLTHPTAAVRTPDLKEDETKKRMKARKGMLQFLMSGFANMEGANQINLQETENGIMIRMSNPMLFETGKADIKPEMGPILHVIAELIRKNAVIVRVEGHTDNVPIHNEEYKSNWELSADRAINIVHYFVEKENLDPTRFNAIAYGEYKPIDTNDTPDGRARNRRVEIYVDLIERPVIDLSGQGQRR